MEGNRGLRSCGGTRPGPEGGGAARLPPRLGHTFHRPTAVSERDPREPRQLVAEERHLRGVLYA